MYNVQLTHSFHCFEFIELTLDYIFYVTSLKSTYKLNQGFVLV